MAISAHTWVVGEILTAANMNTYLRDNVADLQSNKVVMKTGNYTGDGSDPQAITGIGFTPICLWIWKNATDAVEMDTFVTSTDMLATDPDGMSVVLNKSGGVLIQRTLDFLISALGSDGFSVGATANTNAVVYTYVAFGAE